MTISAILSSFGKNIDSVTVVRILKKFVGQEVAKIKYGILSSKVDALIALPLSFNIAISTALIPEISRKKAANDINGIIEKIKQSLTMTIIIAIPCAFGMFAYSKSIFSLLFPKAQEGYNLLSLASISIIFSMITQTIYGILQGIGKNKVSVYASTIGLIVKIICNIILIPIAGVYEKGAIVGNIMSNFISFIIAYSIMKKNIFLDESIFKLLIKPTIASVIMIISSMHFYRLLILRNINYTICTVLAIIIAIIIYIFLFFIMKMMKIKDVSEKLENTENRTV